MITVRLYGHLGKKFGTIHKYAIKNPVEALRAIEANYKGFKQAIQDPRVYGYKFIVDGQDRSSKEELNYPVDSELKIVPILHGKGGKTGGWIRVIIAVIIIVVLIIFQQYEAVPYVWAFAISQFVQGVAILMYHPPEKGSATRAEQNAGKYFNGAANMTYQGAPVPLAYGRVMSGSLLVHAEVTTLET